MTHRILASDPGVAQTRLPFWQIYQLIEDVAPLIRLGRPRLAAFLRMMRHTSAKDWTNPHRVPVRTSPTALESPHAPCDSTRPPCGILASSRSIPEPTAGALAAL